jgi:hypothetical protein
MLDQMPTRLESIRSRVDQAPWGWREGQTEGQDMTFLLGEVEQLTRELSNSGVLLSGSQASVLQLVRERDAAQADASQLRALLAEAVEHSSHRFPCTAAWLGVSQVEGLCGCWIDRARQAVAQHVGLSHAIPTPACQAESE